MILRFLDHSSSVSLGISLLKNKILPENIKKEFFKIYLLSCILNHFIGLKNFMLPYFL